MGAKRTKIWQVLGAEPAAGWREAAGAGGAGDDVIGAGGAVRLTG